MTTEIAVAEVADRCRTVVDEVSKAVLGKREAIEMVLLGLLADGHVMIEDLPGLAKTLLARSLATATGLSWGRIQFTPDLMPSDLTGSSILDPAKADFVFRPGPLFADLVLGDEINRAPPKTQAAMLEAMGERQVTVDGQTRALRRPFLVLATQNPIEYEGTYPLPEAQLDRFLLRVNVGYPDTDTEEQILYRRLERNEDEVSIDQVLTRDDVLGLQAALEQVTLEPAVVEYIVAIVSATRQHPLLLAGASPRGSLGLMKAVRARAAMAGRMYGMADDVKALAEPVLAHRLTLTPDAWVRGAPTGTIIRECLESVPAPSAGNELRRT